MSHFIRIFFLLSIIAFGQLLALNEPISEKSSIESMYQKHLPPEIFEYGVKNNLVDLMSYEKITEKQNLEGRITIILGTLEDLKYIEDDTVELGKYVEVSFWQENRNIEDNFGGIQLCYQNGRIVGYAAFDADGRDYIAPTPFSEEEEKKAATFILLLMEGGLAKVKEGL